MILQRYIVRDLFMAFLFAFAIVMAVGLLWMATQVLRAYEGAGLSAVAGMAPMAAGYVAPWALLMAASSAVTIVYGRLAADNEIVAMRVSGIHANRVVAPAVLFGILLAGAGYAVNEHVQPYAHYERRKMIQEAALTLLKILPPGEQKFFVGRYIVSYKDARDGRMERPYLLELDPRSDSLKAEFTAAHGTVEFAGERPQLVLSRPRVIRYGDKGQAMESTAGSDVTIPLDTSEIARPPRMSKDMTREELLEFAATTRDPRRRAQALTAFHTRYAQSLAPLLLSLVAVPIGVGVRRASRLVGFGASLPPFIAYLILFFLFQGLGEKGRVSAEAAAWAPDGALFVAAIVLLAGVYRR
jgi:lipopolysaccharide export LptBFGC system permease protein LptF